MVDQSVWRQLPSNRGPAQEGGTMLHGQVEPKRERQTNQEPESSQCPAAGMGHSHELKSGQAEALQSGDNPDLPLHCDLNLNLMVHKLSHSLVLYKIQV